MEDYQTPGPSKSRRGRKRQADEEHLTEEERLKKQKNRDAARKCREKKEKESQDLRDKNQELERENSKLSKEKEQLDNRVIHLARVIKQHMMLGCKLPDSVSAICKEEIERHPENLEFSSRLGETASRMHTPPHTPESPVSASWSQSSHTPSECEQQQGTSVVPPQPPIALFSGAPLPPERMMRRTSSASWSPSSSPALSTQEDRHAGLLHFPVSPSLSPDLSPTSRMTPPQNVRAASSPHSGGRCEVFVPQNRTLGNTEAYYMQPGNAWANSGDKSPASAQSDMDGTLSKVLQGAFEKPDILSEDEVSKNLFSNYRNQDDTDIGQYVLASDNNNEVGAGNSQASLNLASMGFNVVTSSVPQGYSYTEDLQQEERAQDIIQEAENFNTEEEMAGALAENSLVNATNVFAPALLDMYHQMEPSLQQQIKTSHGVATQMVSPMTDGHSDQTSGTAEAVGSIQLQPGSFTGQDQQYLVQNPLGQLQVTQPISAPPGAQFEVTTAGYHHVNPQLQATTAPRQATGQIRVVRVLPNTVGVGTNGGLAQRQVQYDQNEASAGEILTSAPSTVSRSGMNALLHRLLLSAQTNDRSMNGSASTSVLSPQQKKFLSVVFHSPNGQTPDSQKIQIPTYLLQRTNHNTVRSVGLSPACSPQQGTVQTVSQPLITGPANSMHASTLPQSSSAPSPSPLSASSHAVGSLPTHDYSENVQGLPSLGFMDLNSETNIFEKKPSKPSG